MRRLRARLAVRDSEAGLTLIEMLVASAMSVVLVGAVGSMLISAVRNQPKISERAQNISSARWVQERLTREIRTGIRVDVATSSKVSFLTYVRRTTCGGATPLPSGSPAIKCQVTYECTTTSCSRIEAKEGVYTGAKRTIFSGIDSSNVFCYVPSINPDPLLCGPAGVPANTTYIGVSLHIPNPSGPSALTLTDGASLRNATLSN
jgi:type II secretory pathway pseudopilin PulG